MGLPFGAWMLLGNAGTNAGANFLGTTDDEALELHANGHRVLRLEPGDPLLGLSSNNIGGHETNEATSGFGAICGGWVNSVGESGFIGGGFGNTAEGVDAVVVGGSVQQSLDQGSFIGGGSFNIADGRSSVVAGGEFNHAEGEYAAVSGGGPFNHAGGPNSAVGGGEFNHANGFRSTIAGGGSSIAAQVAEGSHSTIGGGDSIYAIGSHSTIGGGEQNTVRGDLGSIGGGSGNVIESFGGTIGGGRDNRTRESLPVCCQVRLI